MCIGDCKVWTEAEKGEERICVMPIAKWGSSSTKFYTDRHYREYN